MENSGPVGGIVAVLIHGIGNPKPGSVKRQAEELLANAGVPNDRVHEFNWNQYVAHPVTLGFLSPRSLSELCAALLNAAWLGFERQDRLVRTGALLLEFALGLFPLFIAALLLRRYPDAAKPIVPVECCASLRSLRDAFLHDWAPVVGGIACLILAMAAIYRSRHMLVAAARRVLLLAIPDPVALCRVGSLHGHHPLLCHVPGRIVSQSDYWLELLVGLAMLLIGAFLIVGALVGAGVIAPQVKLMADVVRYLGMPSYRNGLHGRLRTFITDLHLSKTLAYCSSLTALVR